MMVEMASGRIPDAADIDREVGRFDDAASRDLIISDSGRSSILQETARATRASQPY
jgi:hypothetical protein